jgi:hypothetical protein
MKNITYIDTKTETKIDLTTNKVKEVEQTTERTVKIEQEPNFIKLYLQDICKLNDIPKTGSKLLNELLKYTAYDNMILVPTYIKEKIAKDLNMNNGTVSNSLSKLTKNGILKREGKGAYRLNPYLFGKGKWSDIKKIRAEWEYSGKGRVLTNIEVEQEIENEITDIS